MLRKRVLDPKRLRRVPRQFSWIDQRLVREHYLQRCDAHALALYLVLITVGDRQGLSYYADATLCRALSMDEPRLRQARRCLIDAQLIAYAAPLYQVLSLDPPAAMRSGGMQSMGSSLAQLQTQLGARKASAPREPGT
ncbi:hypothetical protein [Dokdonella sp.]|jgi:hypothetical protein|uniref:hypothetical protein n=1 Tax=Dokdonella sp. TaxID=2291710 RepID=UPI0031C297DF|nr:hypothetical protein [Dokdonella sp.]